LSGCAHDGDGNSLCGRRGLIRSLLRGVAGRGLSASLRQRYEAGGSLAQEEVEASSRIAGLLGICLPNGATRFPRPARDACSRLPF